MCYEVVCFLVAGMVGCVRKVELSGERIDLRSLVGTDLAQKDVIYDGCRVSMRPASL